MRLVFTRSFCKAVATNNDSVAFQYPPTSHVRRHGPRSYVDHSSFRPWLRDEFSFRCVYCLIREQWGRVTDEFDLDHFLPLALAPELAHDYDNLLYACHACNLRKGSRELPDPSRVLTAGSVRIYPDGTMVGLTAEVERIVRVLCLNSPAWTRWRRTWIRIIELAEEHDSELFRQLLSYPDDLPDLTSCRAPENSRPEGLDESAFARRDRGELSETYLT